MNTTDISTTNENQIIIKRLYQSGFTPAEIWNLQIQGLARSTIYYQCELLAKGEDLRQKTGLVRPKLLDEEDLVLIASYMTENRDVYVPDLKQYVSDELGKDVSETTLRRALKDLGLIYKEPKSVSYLNDQIKEDRVEWALKYQNQNWNKVLFTDEATFWLGKSGVACWKPSNQANEHMIPKTIPKVQVWGGFCVNGKVSLKLFSENMDSILYVNILEEKVEEMKYLFRKTSAWSVLQDNDPKHTSNRAYNWFEENRIHVLDWPSYSPDLNPIENLWGWMKKKVAARRPRTLYDLERCIYELWDEISEGHIVNLVNSMPQRCQMVIAAKGDKINY